jgi:hypothetical protein
LELPESELPLPESELPLSTLEPEPSLPEDEPSELPELAELAGLSELPELEELYWSELPEFESSLPEVVATDTPDPLSILELFPIPFPASLLLALILDKSENIGLSLFVIPYAATAAAIHNTIIMEMIIFALSNVLPPINFVINKTINNKV